MVRNIASMSVIALLALFCGGCLVSTSSSVSQSGTVVSEGTFSQIKPGQTTEDWVRATLGQPTSEVALPDGGKILKWTYTEKQQSNGAVFLVFAGHDEKNITHNAYVQVATGVVQNAWRD